MPHIRRQSVRRQNYRDGRYRSCDYTREKAQPVDPGSPLRRTSLVLGDEFQGCHVERGGRQRADHQRRAGKNAVGTKIFSAQEPCKEN